MDRFIASGTECVGADALAAYGADPPKRFKSLGIEGDAAPEYGAAVTRDGRQVGTVTSPASSPRLGTIGLAVLDAGVSGDGERVEVAVGDGTASAEVGPLNRYDPERGKPRS
jgi:glycine cleavage system aminomethyltransferase T